MATSLEGLAEPGGRRTGDTPIHDDKERGSVLGHAFRYTGRYEDDTAILLDYNRRSPSFGLVDIVLTYADTGETKQAHAFRQRLPAARPDFTIANWALTQNCADPGRLERDKQSLAAAELPA
ncbi:MAG: hypothetical protein VW709_07555 [Rickettsiales bacterium]